MKNWAVLPVTLTLAIVFLFRPEPIGLGLGSRRRTVGSSHRPTASDPSSFPILSARIERPLPRLPRRCARSLNDEHTAIERTVDGALRAPAHVSRQRASEPRCSHCYPSWRHRHAGKPAALGSFPA